MSDVERARELGLLIDEITNLDLREEIRADQHVKVSAEIALRAIQAALSLARPAPAGAGLASERLLIDIARFIDPQAWVLIDHWRGKVDRHDLTARAEVKARPSLDKAKAVLDLSRSEVSWECGALSHRGQEPQDCNWPHCGCDPKATEVLQALDEHGYDLVDRHAKVPVAPDDAVGSPFRSAAERIWQWFLDANPSDASSPEEYPDHALMTFDEFVMLSIELSRHFPALTKAPVSEDVIQATTGNLIDRFWELTMSDRREIAESMGYEMVYGDRRNDHERWGDFISRVGKNSDSEWLAIEIGKRDGLTTEREDG